MRREMNRVPMRLLTPRLTTLMLEDIAVKPRRPGRKYDNCGYMYLSEGFLKSIHRVCKDLKQLRVVYTHGYKIFGM